MQNMKKRVIVYCRESRDDYGFEVDRIETQRDILLSFCKRQGLTNIIDIVMDNNISGTKFERLDEIVNKIKRDQVDVLVFKDASRLGRNLLESLKFIELAEEYGVEVLFESEDYNEDFFPLLAWFNEQRAKEDSKKIRRVMTHKMQTGELIVKPVYGYKKVDNKLVPDEIAAPVVKRIFELYAQGNGSRKIAGILNVEGVQTPSELKGNKVKTNIWIQQQVYRIINNPVYIGTMTYRRKQKQSFKSKKCINNHVSKHIVLENHHTPIISKELFYKAQERKVQMKHRSSRQLSLFAGALKCGRCGSSMTIRRRANGEDFYECLKYHQEGAIKNGQKENYGCTRHAIKSRAIIGNIHELFKKVVDDTRYYDTIKYADKGNNKAEIEKQIKQYEQDIKKAKRTILDIYEDKLSGLIDREVYTIKHNEYTDKIERLEKTAEECRLLLQHETKQIDYKLVDELAKRIQDDLLENFDIRRVIDQIIYYEPGEIKQENKLLLQISDEYYKELLDKGGMMVLLK